jgi:catechol 2,3-dioxygenase-like lactoylglutathione lyase family enzyme
VSGKSTIDEESFDLLPHIIGSIPLSAEDRHKRPKVGSVLDASLEDSDMTTVDRKGDSEIDHIIEVRLEGLTLRVADVRRSIEFYGNKLGFTVEINKAPQFAMIRVGRPTGGTIGLLVHDSNDPLGSNSATHRQRAGIHIELTTDHLDALYGQLKGRGVEFFEPPHEEPWERSMSVHDPDGYTIEFAEGRRGHRGVT